MSMESGLQYPKPDKYPIRVTAPGVLLAGLVGGYSVDSFRKGNYVRSAVSGVVAVAIASRSVDTRTPNPSRYRDGAEAPSLLDNIYGTVILGRLLIDDPAIIKEFVLFYSDNDPYDCGIRHGREIQEKVGGKLIFRKGEGHFNLEAGDKYKQFPEILGPKTLRDALYPAATTQTVASVINSAPS